MADKIKGFTVLTKVSNHIQFGVQQWAVHLLYNNRQLIFLSFSSKYHIHSTVTISVINKECQHHNAQ